MRTRGLLFAVALAVLTVVLAAPATAQAPQRLEEPIFLLFPDTENGLAVFVNITREDYCAWEAGGFVGDPPVGELVESQVVETGKGALVGSFRAVVSVELWRLDADVPPLVGPCEDTDGQAGAWATGTAHIAANDNDIDVTLTRTDSFGDKGQATVHDAAGDAWHYSWTFHARISKDDVFTVLVENSNLTRRGN
jgi:hypothetical protein